MALGLIGRKLGMTQVFSSDGELVAVSVIEAGPCVVLQKKTPENDGYEALQLGYGQKKLDKFNKPLAGHMKKAGDQGFRHLREFRSGKTGAYAVGDQIALDIFENGEQVEVTGITKGKGYAGNIKRWGFNRGPMSHGSKFHRVVGSIGSSAYPSRVFKGKKMPGHLGCDRMTAKNIRIVDKRQAENIILVKGVVPGPKNGIVVISKKSD
ncbi:MAG: 50S ribosomal protein L3 [Deltaproteobacteria bacterium]|nr:50S ribosomal protein L3 [Deltaproteobacteria bacterium]